MKSSHPLLCLIVASLGAFIVRPTHLIAAEKISSGKPAIDAPIKLVPEPLTTRKFNKQLRAWFERIIETPFRERVKGKEWAADAERFVSAGLDDWALPDHKTDPKSAKQFLDRGVDDPLVLWLAAYFTWMAEGLRPGREVLLRAFAAAEAPGVQRALSWMIATDLLDNYSHTKRRDAALEAKSLEFLGAAIEEGSFDGNDAKIFVHFQYSRPGLDFDDGTTDLLAPIYAKERLPEWARATLRGHVLLKRAWKVRGNGWAYTVAPENWVGFAEHLKAARPLLVRGWELQPERPEAATDMIRLTMTGHGSADDSVRLWFDRAIAAQCNYRPAFEATLWSLRPRWGGSHQMMIAFGRACLNTGRFDTNVPDYFIGAVSQVASELEDWRLVYQDPKIASDIIRLMKACLNEPSLADESAYNRTALMIDAYLCGKLDLAAETLKDAPSPLLPEAVGVLHKYGSDLPTFLAEVAMQKRGVHDLFEKAERARERGQAAEGLKLIDDLRKKAGPEELPLLAAREKALRFDDEFAKGNWVKLAPEPDFSGWRQLGGKWEVDADGVLVAHGTDDRSKLVFDGKMGADFEMRGEFSANPADPVFRGFGFVFGHSGRTCGVDAISWASAQVLQRGSEPIFTASVSARRGQTEDKGRVDVTLDEWNRFELNCQKGRVTWKLNGREIVNESAIAGVHLAGHPGFGTTHSRAGNTARYRNVEVRRLSPAK